MLANGQLDTPTVLRRQQEAAAIERLNKAVSFESTEDLVLSALEAGFFELLVLWNDSFAGADSMRRMCAECNQITEIQLQSLFDLEANFYRDVPKKHKDYLQLLDLEAVLESEATAWKVIADLVSNRTERPVNDLLSQSSIQASSEQDFVTQWKLQQDVICDVEIVVTAIEQAYGKRFPVHLCLSSLSRADSNPAKTFFGNEVHRLRLKDGQAATNLKHEKEVEFVFALIYRCIRAGDWNFAYDLCKQSGMGLFSINFLSRRYSQSSEHWKKISNCTEEMKLYDRRLKWRQLAWDASNSERLGVWEKAVWGIFCGNWKAVLPVAESWEDEIWIYLTCYVDIATEKAVAQSKPIFDESGLPMDIWESSFTLDDVFVAVANSKNSMVRGQSENVFRHSIRCALLNDSQDMLVEIEKFIIEASELCSSSLNGGVSREVRRSTGSGIRFALHTLLLMQRVNIVVDPVLFGRCCYFHVMTATSTNPELWASYLDRITNDIRGDAVKQFFSQSRLTPSERADFLSSMARRDPQNSLAVFRSFIDDHILSNPLKIANHDATTFAKASTLLANEDPSIQTLVFAVINRVLRSLLLPLPTDANRFHQLYSRWENAIDSLLAIESSEGDAPLKSETACWKIYMAGLLSFSDWRVIENLSEKVDDYENIKEKAVRAGYEILSTADWIAERPSSDPVADLDFDIDHNAQLKILRGLTLSGVYTFVIEILHSSVDKAEEVAQLKNMLEVSKLIMKDFDSKIGDLSTVEESLEKVKATAQRIFSDIRYANYLNHDLKRSFGQFKSEWEKLEQS